MKDMLQAFAVIAFIAGMILGVIAFLRETAKPPTPQERYDDSVNAAHQRLAADAVCRSLEAWTHDPTVSFGVRSDRVAEVMGTEGGAPVNGVRCYQDSTGHFKSRE